MVHKCNRFLYGLEAAGLLDVHSVTHQLKVLKETQNTDAKQLNSPSALLLYLTCQVTAVRKHAASFMPAPCCST